ncbi:tetratricopeptide repeat protein [Niveispirillum fermenti]|uniref:tetratricopeptide repeat protein n=1 Tax=Niveispirillum fermenti TaxID=1233113 RepID=UPI003A8A0BC4
MSQATKRMTPEQAVSLHQAGDVAGAAAAYRLLLARDPQNAQLLNLLGVASLQLGQPAAAVDLLRQAARRQPANPDVHDNLGSALRAAGQAAAAVAAHRQALKLKPGHPPFHFNLGNALAAMGAHRQAADEYRHALAGRPGHGGTRFNLANSLRALGELDAAAATYRELLSVQADHAQAWNNLGAVLSLQGELGAAEEAYSRALALRPDHAETLSNLGNVLVQRGKLGAALACHRAAVQAAPGSAEAHIFLGVALQELDELAAATQAYQAGLRIEPENVRGLANLGSVLEQAGDLAGAEAVLSRALALQPGFAETWGNLGLCHLARGDRDRARAALDRALELDPDLARARVSRALLRLAGGDLEGGWPDYAWRFAAGEAQPDRRFDVPVWRGEPLEKGHLLIWREQGLGDELMFASLYGDAIARAGRTTIDCDPRLVGLFTRSFPRAVVRPAPPSRPDHDHVERAAADRHVPAGDLPALLRGGSLAGFTGAPYLVPDRRRRDEMQAWLDGLPAGLRVGLCWRSRLLTHRRQHNYLDVAQWAPLAGLDGLQPVCLQYDAMPEECAALERLAGRPLHRVPGLDLTDDLEGVAALVAGLDLVVTAPTAVGEMAGALGTPVWRVVPTGDDWSLLGAGVRPWFAVMRPFMSGGAGGIGLAVSHLRQILDAHA